MADAPDSESGGVTLEGSTPSFGTILAFLYAAKAQFPGNLGNRCFSLTNFVFVKMGKSGVQTFVNSGLQHGLLALPRVNGDGL